MTTRTDARSTADTDAPRATPPSRGAARGVLWLAVGAAVSKGSQTVVLLLLAVVLEPSALGVLAIGSLVLVVTNSLTDVGSSTALVYWRGDAERAARTALTIALGTSLALLAGAWWLAPWLTDTMHGGDQGIWVIRGMVLGLPLYAIAGVSGELLRRDLSFARRVLPDIVGSLIGGAVAVVLALHGVGVYALVIGQGVQAVFRVLVSWGVRPPVRPGWIHRDAQRLLGYGRSLAGSNALQLLMFNVDYLLVGHVLGSRPLGEYSLAYRLAYMPYPLIALVIGGAAFAYLCRLEGAAVGQALVEVGAVTVTVLAPLYVGMVLLAPQLQLLGDQWAPAVPALRWLAGYGLVLAVVNLCTVALNAVGRTRDSFLLNMLHLVVLVALLAAVVDAGITAVAVAQVAAGLATVVVALLVVGHRVPGAEWLPAVRSLGAVALGLLAMTVVVLVVRPLLPGVSATALAVIGSLALLGYAVPVALFGGHRFRSAARLLEATP